MGATATRLTADEYLKVTANRRERTELIDGAIVVNDPKPLHQELAGTIYMRLRTWAEAGPGRGRPYLPTNVRVDEHNLFSPDVLWIAERHRLRDLNRYPERVPDICVEVRSYADFFAPTS